MNGFYQALIQSLNSNLFHYYLDNFDHYRFNKKVNRVKDYIIYLATRMGFVNRSISLIRLEKMFDHFEGLNKTYQLMSDQRSKDLLVTVFAYRLLGYRKVKLPLNTPEYWKTMRYLEGLKQNDDFIDPGFQQFLLHRFSLKAIGYDILFYYSARGIMQDFVAKQYEYKLLNNIIKAQTGDVVIDCGGCWGDTALYFAHEVGVDGKVYSFEFVPSNIEIFNKNLSLNPALKNRIELNKQPVWSEASLPIFILDNGPASRVSFDEIAGGTQLMTTTIDQLVSEQQIDRVDFIKMDIEGAELNALKGAEAVIRKFKPTLAIALYHRVEDFYQIPGWINNLGLGYHFYIGHYTIHQEETILFCRTK